MMEELKKLRDLTETLTGNGYLRDQADEWEYALDAMPDCIYIINTKSELKFINKSLENRLGVSRSKLYGHLYFDIVDNRLDNELLCNGGCNEWPGLKLNINDMYVEKLRGWFNITKSPIYTKANKLIGFICVLQDITEKKKALFEVMAREAMLETIFEAVPIGMGLLEEGTRKILSVNKFFLDLIGYSEEEIINESTRILYLDQEEFERVGKEKHGQIELTGVGEVETQFITKNGQVLDIFLRTGRIKDDKKLVFTVTDITDRKRKERILALDEERLQSSLKLSTMDQSSEEEVTDYALEEAVRLTDSKIGYLHFVEGNFEDGINLSLFKWSSGVHKDCKAEKVDKYPLDLAGCWADCVRTKQPVIHNDYFFMTAADGKKGLPEGHIPLVRHMSVPVMEGNKVVAVAGVGNKEEPYNSTDLNQLSLFMNSMWDILKRKKAERAYKTAIQKFKAIFDMNRDVITVVQLGTGIVADVNPAFEKYSGFTRDEAIGKDVVELDFWVNTGDRDKFYELLGKNGFLEDMEVTFRDKSGGTYQALLTSSIAKIGGELYAISIAEKIKQND